MNRETVKTINDKKKNAHVISCKLIIFFSSVTSGRVENVENIHNDNNYLVRNPFLPNELSDSNGRQKRRDRVFAQ